MTPLSWWKRCFSPPTPTMIAMDSKRPHPPSLATQAVSQESKTIFITVGTTLFEELIHAATSPAALQWMIQHGYSRVIIQYGRGSKPIIPGAQHIANGGSSNHVVVLEEPTVCSGSKSVPRSLNVEMYDFKPSLLVDMQRSSLIISHAGAGTVMEVLRQQHQRLVVVINNSLMDNHQMELAQAMASRNYLHVVRSPQDMNLSTSFAALNIWDAFESFRPTRFPPGSDQDFSTKVHEFYRFYSDENDSADIIPLAWKGTSKKKAS
jgi:beta-1,4-N-acetylglucosaminyltransferase